MKITRLFTGNDEESHFEELDLPISDKGDIGWLSSTIKATGVIFRETGDDYNFDWHNAPCRQFVIMLEGWVEIQTGSGDTRRFGPGDILLAEDTTGRGHISRTPDKQPRKSIFVILDQEFVLE